MFRIVLNSHAYEVQFDYDDPITICSILDVTNPDEPTLYEAGIALRAKQDQHVKEIGRKVSLTRALAHPEKFDKNARRLFWAAYFARRNRSKVLSELVEVYLTPEEMALLPIAQANDLAEKRDRQAADNFLDTCFP